VIIAITDGNSDPRNVESLRPYFDIVVNSEQVGVAKPDARVYLKAAEQLLEHPRLEDVFLEAMGACKMLDDAVEKTDLLETAIGPWWVHIGDDFMKDIVAARDLGMRTIWSRELVRKAPNSAEEKDSSAAKQLNGREGNSGGQTKKRSVADLVEELATMKVVEMSIGADEFLADSIHREFADEIVDDFASIADLLHEWHLDGSSSNNKDGSSPSSPAIPPGADEPKNEPKKDSAADSKSKKKFCVFCGTKLPFEANFCSSCGEPSVQVK
jgi:ribosomal protein L40E